MDEDQQQKAPTTTSFARIRYTHRQLPTNNYTIIQLNALSIGIQSNNKQKHSILTPRYHVETAHVEQIIDDIVWNQKPVTGPRTKIRIGNWQLVSDRQPVLCTHGIDCNAKLSAMIY